MKKKLREDETDGHWLTFPFPFSWEVCHGTYANEQNSTLLASFSFNGILVSREDRNIEKRRIPKDRSQRHQETISRGGENETINYAKQ